MSYSDQRNAFDALMRDKPSAGTGFAEIYEQIVGDAFPLPITTIHDNGACTFEWSKELYYLELTLGSGAYDWFFRASPSALAPGGQTQSGRGLSFSVFALILFVGSREGLSRFESRESRSEERADAACCGHCSGHGPAPRWHIMHWLALGIVLSVAFSLFCWWLS